MLKPQIKMVTTDERRDVGIFILGTWADRKSATERPMDGLEACPRRKIPASRRLVTNALALQIKKTKIGPGFGAWMHFMSRERMDARRDQVRNDGEGSLN